MRQIIHHWQQHQSSTMPVKWSYLSPKFHISLLITLISFFQVLSTKLKHHPWFCASLKLRWNIYQKQLTLKFYKYASIIPPHLSNADSTNFYANITSKWVQWFSRGLADFRLPQWCLVSTFVSWLSTRHMWKEDALVEELPPSYWPIGVCIPLYLFAFDIWDPSPLWAVRSIGKWTWAVRR